MNFREACLYVTKDCPNTYAQAYAKAGLELWYQDADRETIKVQCLYILNNIQHWRGPIAKEVRQTLKTLSH